MTKNEALKKLVAEKLTRAYNSQDEDLKIKTHVLECRTTGTVARIALRYKENIPCQGVEMNTGTLQTSLEEAVQEHFEFSPVQIEGTEEEVRNWVQKL